MNGPDIEDRREFAPEPAEPNRYNSPDELRDQRRDEEMTDAMVHGMDSTMGVLS